MKPIDAYHKGCVDRHFPHHLLHHDCARRRFVVPLSHFSTTFTISLNKTGFSAFSLVSFIWDVLGLNFFHYFYFTPSSSLFLPPPPKSQTQEIVKLVGEQAKGWLAKVQEGEPIPLLLEKLYETKEIRTALKALIEQAEGDLAQYGAASNELQRLNDRFRQQTNLLDKVLPKLKWGLLIPTSALPQGKLVLGLFYIVLTGYSIYLGADYVDAPRLRRLGRVPGVRSVIESQLNAGG